MILEQDDPPMRGPRVGWTGRLRKACTIQDDGLSPPARSGRVIADWCGRQGTLYRQGRTLPTNRPKSYCLHLIAAGR